MAQSNQFHGHELVSLSVGGLVFTTPLATLQGPAAQGSVLARIAEEYTRRSIASRPVSNTSTGGTAQGAAAAIFALPGLQDLSGVIEVPNGWDVYSSFGHILSCLRRMDDGLNILMPADASKQYQLLQAAQKLGISSLVALLKKQKLQIQWPTFWWRQRSQQE